MRLDAGRGDYAASRIPVAENEHLANSSPLRPSTPWDKLAGTRSARYAAVAPGVYALRELKTYLDLSERTLRE